MFAVPSKDCPAIVLAFCKAVAVLAFPSKLATSVPVEIVKFPVLAPVKLPVPTVKVSALSSHPINTLSEEPLSSTKPASFAGLPLVPVPSSMSMSSIVVFVAGSYNF